MKKYGWLIILLFCLGLVSCGKKEQKEELTPLNAIEKYGGVMGNALKKTKAMDNTLYLKNKIITFQRQEGRYPYSLDELVEYKLIKELPEPPTGMSFRYDPTTGSIGVQ
ncbi:MAG: hypothetical protein ACOX1Z_03720 [Candidatus Ratteibacteria bacterium]